MRERSVSYGPYGAFNLQASPAAYGEQCQYESSAALNSLCSRSSAHTAASEQRLPAGALEESHHVECPRAHFRPSITVTDMARSSPRGLRLDSVALSGLELHMANVEPVKLVKPFAGLLRARRK